MRPLTLASLCLLAVATSAAAQDTDLRSYDGYCYVRSKQAKTTGTVIGVVTGGLIGSQISKNERGLGAVAGAAIGGVIGNKVARNGGKCWHDEYYSYQGHYYDPQPAPKGYTVVFYKDRPAPDLYKAVYYDPDHHTTPPPYAYNDTWHKN